MCPPSLCSTLLPGQYKVALLFVPGVQLSPSGDGDGRLSQVSGNPSPLPHGSVPLPHPIAFSYRKYMLGQIPKELELLSDIHTNGSVCYTIPFAHCPTPSYARG